MHTLGLSLWADQSEREREIKTQRERESAACSLSDRQRGCVLKAQGISFTLMCAGVLYGERERNREGERETGRGRDREKQGRREKE